MGYQDYFEQLKSHCDIVEISRELGCLPSRKIGNRYQGGDCPARHDSEGKRCFCIWPEIQAFKCFHCGTKGDVIELVMLARGIGFREAIDWLADFCGMPRLATKEMTPKERVEYEAKQTEKRTIFDVLTEAASFYHEILLADKKMMDHLHRHYGLTQNTTSDHYLGYSTGEGLFKHLLGRGFNKERIVATALFVRVGSKWMEFFNHRLTFPYWKTGKVVYFIGRKTDRTPDKSWETAKYKKLPAKSEDRPYISEFIQNKWFFGEDTTRGADKVFVAEGVTDCLAMLQAGFSTISPVTTRFRDEDAPHLIELTQGVNAVYLVP